MKSLRVGIIGCGLIATEKHLPNLKKVEGVSIVGFMNRTKQKAINALEIFGDKGAQVYDTAEALIADPNIDIVHICTPNKSHADLTIKALNAKKHVMVEKPMAKTAKEALAMQQAALDNNCMLSVAYNNRFRSDVVLLKHKIQQGDLGKIYFAKAHAVRRRKVPTWGTFLDHDIQGGGPLIDIGSHALDMALYLMDDYQVDYVVGSVYDYLKDTSADDNVWGTYDPKEYNVETSAFAMIKMRSGSTIILESSFLLNTRDEDEAKVSLSGTKAGADMKDGLTINYGEGTSLLDQTHHLLPNDMGEAEMASWIQAIREQKDPLVTAAQGVQVTRIIDAIYESARTNTPIYLNAEMK